MRAILVLAAASASATLAVAQGPPVPIGSQFQVNTYIQSDQIATGVAVAGDISNFVVVWASDGSSGGDTSSYSIQGQLFDSDSVPIGSQFQVNSYTTSTQIGSHVAADNDGDFVVVWDSLGADNGDSSYRSVQGQRYDDGASPQGSQFRINTYTSLNQSDPEVAVDFDGDFVVAWKSDGSSGTDDSFNSIQAQRFDSGGTAQGSEFQVNSYTTGFQNLPSVAMNADGAFIVAWDSSSQSDPDLSIQAQRFASNGTTVGSQFQVSTYTTSFQTRPAVALASTGEFAVAWDSNGSSGNDTSGYSIHARLYDANGNALGPAFEVNNYTTGNQRAPRIAMDGDGDFIVAWQSEGSGGGDNSATSIQARHFSAGGVPQGEQIQVNSYTTDGQITPRVSAEIGGAFVVVWTSYGSGGTDSQFYSVQAQRFNVSLIFADGFERGDASRWSDIQP